MPIAIPKGVDVTAGQESISVKGSLGTLVRQSNKLVTVKNEAGKLSFVPANESAEADAMSGTMRALVANMVSGVSKGFERKLNLVGVGFRAQAQGQKLNLQIGFSHPVVKDMPAGIKVECPTQTEIVIKGADRQVVGQIAAEVRAIRPPEPYKGKGIRYEGEYVRRKAGKTGKAK
jgi:large subunit ribosomal protein L6